MSGHRLTIRLSGHNDRSGAIELKDFAQVCEAVSQALRSIEQMVSGRSGKTGFEIRDLHAGSAVLVVDAVRRSGGGDYRGQVISTFRRAINDLNKGTISADLALLDLEPFIDLARILKNGVKAIKIGRVRLTDAFADNLDKVVPPGISSHGTVTGVLERVNVHERNEFALYPPGSTTQIACRFPDGELDNVRKGLKRTVTVSGEMHYASGNPYPRRCVVTGLLVHPAVSALPTLFDVRELGSWGTDGLSAVDFCRTIREQ